MKRKEFAGILTCVDGSLGDVTDSRSLNDVADDELLDRLVLGHTTSTVGASNGLHVSTVVFTTSSITAFLRL